MMNIEAFKKGFLGRIFGLITIVVIGVGVTCGGNFAINSILTPFISDIWFTLWVLWLIECGIILLYTLYQVIFRFEEISFSWIKMRLMFILEISLFLSLLVVLPSIILLIMN